MRRAEIHLRTRRHLTRRLRRVNTMGEVESGNMTSVMALSLTGSRSRRQGGWVKLDITRAVADTGNRDWR